jgi:hypothetical protein
MDITLYHFWIFMAQQLLGCYKIRALLHPKESAKVKERTVHIINFVCMLKE